MFVASLNTQNKCESSWEHTTRTMHLTRIYVRNRNVIVTCCCNKHHFGVCFSKGLLFGNRILITTKTHAQYISTIGCCIVNTFNNSSYVATSIRLQHCNRHNKCFRISACNTNSIFTNSRSNTSTVSTMTIVVTHIRRLIHKVPSMNIIFKTIVIIIYFIFTSFFRLISPNISLKVGMLSINTSIENCNN